MTHTFTDKATGRECECDIAFEDVGIGAFECHGFAGVDSRLAPLVKSARWTDTGEAVDYDELPEAIRDEIDALDP
jgi:hypothetical protein